ncbi:MAG: FAD-dependent oxidoreductase [Phycisphaerales bacterium]
MSGKLSDQTHEHPADGTCDVLVYGGTAGGVMAAVAAAREGASVVILEPGKHLGGMVSGGLSATDAGNPSAIGGITREYFERIGKVYGNDGPAWQHEPHVAEDIFNEMVREAKIRVIYNARLKQAGAVAKQNNQIVSVTTENGGVYQAKQFIDATYEGDLMAQAGVAYTVGRESVQQYGEERAGVRPPVRFGYAGSAFDEKGLLPDIDDGPYGDIGAADHRIMAYTFRLCLTREPDNRIRFEKPDGYDPRRYALLLHVFKARPKAKMNDFILPVDLPNGKIDANNCPGMIVSTNLHNGSWDYPDADYQRRDEIWREHESYVRGFFYFLANDPNVPQSIRDEVSQWGLPRDEFQAYNGWPHQLYVRAGRRMIGEVVITAHDLLNGASKPDAVAMGTYFLDSHRTRRVVLPNGDVATEGGVGGEVNPYDIPYGCISPKQNECGNLLVPVCLSSSGVAWCSLRMEPVFMALGHAAGTASAMAAKAGLDAQDVDIEKLRERLLAQQQVIGRTDLPTMKEHQHTPLLAPSLVPVVEATDPRTLRLPGQKRASTQSS